MIDKGWVKLHRCILENPIVCKDSDYFTVWVYLLLEATHVDYEKVFKGNKIVLKPGQLLTGRKVISDKFRISESKVKRILIELESDQQIERERSNRNSLITILNWDKYQCTDQQNDQQMTNRWTANDQLVTTLQEHKNINNNTSEIKKRNSDKQFTIDSKEYKLAEYMLKKIKEICPNFKEPNMQRWCSDFDKILRIDKRSPNETVSLITKIYEDDFWKKNILSPDKLRKQYDRLIIQFKESA